MGVLSWWFAVVLCFLFILRQGEVHPLLQALTTMMSDLSSQSQVTMHRILLAVLPFYLCEAAGLSQRPQVFPEGIPLSVWVAATGKLTTANRLLISLRPDSPSTCGKYQAFPALQATKS